MEENMIQPTQKESFKTPLIVLIVLFVLYGIVGYFQTINITWEDYQNIMSVSPGGDRVPEEMQRKTYDSTQAFAFVSFIAGITRLGAMLVVSVILFFGFNIASKRQNFKTIFKCVIYAEVVVFVQSTIFAFLTMHFHYDCYSQSQISPLSVLSFLNVCNLEAYMIGILKYVSVFEVLYFGVLAYFLVKNIPDVPKNQVIKIAAYCYGIILLICMLRDTLTLIGTEKLANL